MTERKVADHKAYQSEVFRLLDSMGFDPTDVKVIHLENQGTWVELFVRDEKGRMKTTWDDFGNMVPVTTVVPVRWVGAFHDEEELA